jgi:hypothetical protein
MDQQQTDRLASAAKARSVAQERQAERTAEIAGKQAQLKQEAQARRDQQQSKQQQGEKSTRQRTA